MKLTYMYVCTGPFPYCLAGSHVWPHQVAVWGEKEAEWCWYPGTSGTTAKAGVKISWTRYRQIYFPPPVNWVMPNQKLRKLAGIIVGIFTIFCCFRQMGGFNLVVAQPNALCLRTSTNSFRDDSWQDVPPLIFFPMREGPEAATTRNICVAPYIGGWLPAQTNFCKSA